MHVLNNLAEAIKGIYIGGQIRTKEKSNEEYRGTLGFRYAIFSPNFCIR